ncbi:MAG: inorganic phosphate transporter [Bacteroidaceae bacterium]|nr:inorganic phosphate transporter [Bacteroidaceae bacterium]
METIFIGIVGFLIVLAIFDLAVGVSNDAVNFINSAIGSKAASFKTIITIAAIGVFAGAALSNGMMDIARHGIFSPSYFSFYDIMCIFLAVMITDVVLLDVFNTLGMPTSTTVSLVFELLGGTFVLALLKLAGDATDENGVLLTLNELLNSDKALSVILAIFLSVAIAFVFGTFVQWISRVCFTFTYSKNARVKTSIFGGIAITSIIYFLLIKGLKGSTIMTKEATAWVNDNTAAIVVISFVAFTILMYVLNLLKVNVLKIVVMFGTFALATAFAGNDLVNFVGVPLTGLDAFLDYSANGNGDPNSFMMHSLNESAHTPLAYLIGAGVVMVLALTFSKKAHNVVKTSVDLSRQDEGDEMFGSSAVARTLVRTTSRIAATLSAYVPKSLSKWVDSRFNSDEARLPQGAAFDLIRASVNLVLAGLLVALGTSLKLPLSTTYVTFMVAMGSSLADRAWSRESAVFRITGVLSVIGGWFITAGVAFGVCFIVTLIIFFGKFPAMFTLIIVAIIILVRSNIKYSKKKESEVVDTIFTQLVRSNDKDANWGLLCEHIRQSNGQILQFVKDTYTNVTDAFFQEEYRRLKHAKTEIDEERKEWKRQRRREIIGLRRVDQLHAIERNTWFFLGSNSSEQLLYCLKRINDPSREHVGNSFTPVPQESATAFFAMRDAVVKILERTINMLHSNDMPQAEAIRTDSQALQATLSRHRKEMLDRMHDNNTNLEAMLVYINIVQESQVLVSTLRHLIRGVYKFQMG